MRFIYLQCIMHIRNSSHLFQHLQNVLIRPTCSLVPHTYNCITLNLQGHVFLKVVETDCQTDEPQLHTLHTLKLFERFEIENRELSKT